MADLTAVAADPLPPFSTNEFVSVLSIPPLDNTMLSKRPVTIDDFNLGDERNDVDILDFEIFFDDICVHSSDFEGLFPGPAELEKFNSFDIQPEPDPSLEQFGSGANFDPCIGVFKSTSAELRRVPGEEESTRDNCFDTSGVLYSASPALESHQISAYLNVPSPESDGSNRAISEDFISESKELTYPSPETQGSGNFESNVSDNSNNCATGSGSSSSILNNDCVENGFVDHEIKLEESGHCNHNVNHSSLKRKKGWNGLANDGDTESRIHRLKASNCDADNDNIFELDEGEEKRKARLMRNRESAQLSRQRKKHYVEELEDKVKRMQSTIQDLNARISYFMSENVTLRQQMGSGGIAAPPPQMGMPPPGMYPNPAMMYPCMMPGAPPYMMKPQGSQAAVVPIPRLKPQLPEQTPKASKKVQVKKNDGPKTKKVAGVSFLGLLFFIMLFGGLFPMISVRYGGLREALISGESDIGSDIYEKHRGRVLMVNGTEYGEKSGGRRDCRSSSSSKANCGEGGHGRRDERNVDDFAHIDNRSEPLVASLFVPRNDKLLKIDGNLIIHSVLASEKAMTSNKEEDAKNGLAFLVDLAPAIPLSGVGRNRVRHPHLRAIGSSSTDKESSKSIASDGRLQEWFREGLAGPLLSSEMCTEVFQFDVSPASSSGVIFPATSRNISQVENQNSTHVGKGRNRRLLHDQSVPLAQFSHNTLEEHKQRNSQNGNLNESSLASSMVVSVLVDPREAGAGDVDGVMGKNSISRIFVVILMDSVKYVTYSCMLPFMGSAPHLVTN